MPDDPRRSVPRTDVVLADARLLDAVDRLGARRVKDAVVAAQERCRRGDLPPERVADAAVAALPLAAASLRPVLNATGVIVHTNLGRAPLSAAARQALDRAAGTTDLELDLSTGERGTRGRSALAALAAAVPDAEDVLVVNNGAAALSLIVHALAWQREIVVARGELVEIGGGFRVPDLLIGSGARLREVGTTNRVTRADYADAVGEHTALVLKVHPSNFHIGGFTASVPLKELASLPVPLVADIGSGLLAPHPRLPDEPDAASALRAGAALVTASADKLLGGPQAGLVLGSAELIARLRRHPVARALRVDKLTLAALEASLQGPPTPVAAALASDRAALFARAKAVSRAVSDLVAAEAVHSIAVVGGGGAPGVELGSAAIALPARLSEPLRLGQPSVMGHLGNGRLLLDLILLEPRDDALVIDAIRRVASEVEDD